MAVASTVLRERGKGRLAWGTRTGSSPPSALPRSLCGAALKSFRPPHSPLAPCQHRTCPPVTKALRPLWFCGLVCVAADFFAVLYYWAGCTKGPPSELPSSSRVRQAILFS